MKRATYLLGLIGGIFGIFNQAFFLFCGSIGIAGAGAIADARRETISQTMQLFWLKGLLALAVCATAIACATIIKTTKKDLERLTATIVLVGCAGGLLLLLSYVSAIPIIAASITSSLAVWPDFQKLRTAGKETSEINKLIVWSCCVLVLWCALAGIHLLYK